MRVGLQPAATGHRAAAPGGNLQHAARMVGAGFFTEVPAVELEKRADAATEIEDGPVAAQKTAGLQPAGDDLAAVADKYVAHFRFVGDGQPVPVAGVHRRSASRP